MRIAEERQRDAPIGDGAVRIGLDGFLINLLRFGIPERVLITHATVKPPLRNLVAGRREMHLAKFLVGIVLGKDR